MSFNFPDSPTVDQVFPPYQWDGEKWIVQTTAGQGYALVYVGDAPPSNPTDGQLWWDSTVGVLYFYFFDGSSRQWVIVRPEQGPQGLKGDKGDTGTAGALWTQITQAAYNALSPPNPTTLYVIIG
jgi:hypothetical protein